MGVKGSKPPEVNHIDYIFHGWLLPSNLDATFACNLFFSNDDIFLSCRLPKLYLCEFCLKYMKSTSILMRHMVIKTCMQRPLFSSCYSISLWDQKSLLSCFCRQSVNGFILQQTKFTAKVKSLCLRWMVQLTRWVRRKTFQNFISQHVSSFSVSLFDVNCSCTWTVVRSCPCHP